MLYKMLTGGKPEGAFLYPSEMVKGLPKKWDAVIKKCLQYSPEDRFQSASDVADAIRPIGKLLRKPVIYVMAISS